MAMAWGKRANVSQETIGKRVVAVFRKQGGEPGDVLYFFQADSDKVSRNVELSRKN